MALVQAIFSKEMLVLLAIAAILLLGVMAVAPPVEGWVSNAEVRGGIGTQAEKSQSHAESHHGTEAQEAREQIDRCVNGGGTYEITTNLLGRTIVRCTPRGSQDGAIQVIQPNGFELTAYLKRGLQVLGMMIFGGANENNSRNNDPGVINSNLYGN